MNTIKESIFRIINYVSLGRLGTGFYLLSKNHLSKSGWKKSVKKRMPIDRGNNELPWFTYGCIYFLNSKLKNWFSVFEYGCGNSTIWFGKRTKSVISVEHNEDWHNKMRSRFSKFANIKNVYRDLESKSYEKEILMYQKEFDIIVLDGRERVNCSFNALNALKDDGVIIWDNSDRIEYQKGYDHLISNGFKRIDFYGMGPISTHSWCTSIFYKKDNCLDI